MLLMRKLDSISLLPIAFPILVFLPFLLDIGNNPAVSCIESKNKYIFGGVAIIVFQIIQR